MLLGHVSLTKGLLFFLFRTMGNNDRGRLFANSVFFRGFHISNRFQFKDAIKGGFELDILFQS